MALSKTKYCNALQCHKMGWLEEHCPNEKGPLSSEAILDNGTEVGKVAKDLLGPHIDIKYNEDLEVMLSDTKHLLLLQNVVITEASFFYDSLFCSVDLLKKQGDSFEVYEVKSATELKPVFIEDLAYQVYILLQLGYRVDKASVVYLNRNYVRKGNLNLKELFHVEEVTSIVFDKQKEVARNIKEIISCNQQKEEPEQVLGMQCVKPYDCPFFAYCTKSCEKPNVFDLRRMQQSKKFAFYQKGVYRFEDLLKEKIDWKIRQQIEFELYQKEPFIDKKAIASFIDTLSYPLYFLDFETFQQAIPLYDGIKPYMQIPFQYSLHYIEKENGKLEHKEFLAEALKDPRRALAEQLVQDIPQDVTVLAYNMSFEKTVIKQLAYLFSDLSDHLMNIHDHICDLMIPFSKRSYYTKEMQGSYSIKYVLPALFPNDPSLDYHHLELIHNGSEAMNAFARLGELSLEEQQQVRKNLLIYCQLDTYAMVKIWEVLKDIVLEKV